MSDAERTARRVARCEALAIYFCARNRVSKESTRVAIEGCSDLDARGIARVRPKVLATYEAMLRSLPRGER